MDAWFSPQTALWLTFLSLLAVTAALRDLAKKGLYRSAVMAVHWVVFGLGIALLISAGTAILLHQPWYVVFPLSNTEMRNPCLFLIIQMKLRIDKSSDIRILSSKTPDPH